MSKKVIILISVFVLLLAAGGGYLIVSSKNKSGSISTPVGENLTSKEIASADLDYSDASGFSFKYPKSLRVEDVTPSDDSYYSKVSLTKSGGKLTITVKDETAKTVDEFLLSDDYYKNATLSGATTLAGMPARQYSLDGKLITIALKDGILYQVEGDKDAGFWEDTQGVVVSTFSFGLKSSGSASSDESNTTYEAEEVVE
ncbi:MAG: hypothetical protein NTV24_00195 [Candidatus Woesebacteria bacterium]|nr:hypothetical protein [Candidatus Woesebacteria bacterium]